MTNSLPPAGGGDHRDRARRQGPPGRATRVAILLAYKLEDHFFVETYESATIAALNEAGHEAAIVEYLFDRSRSDGDHFRILRQRLVDRGDDLILVVRPWSQDFLSSLRGLPIVGVAHPRYLEQRFYSMALANVTPRVVVPFVDAWSSASLDGVRGFGSWRGDRLDRGHPVQGPTIRHDLLREEFDFEHRESLSEHRSNPARIILLGNEGCAYRKTKDSSGQMDGLDLPATVVKTGCTFCQVAPYESLTVPETLEFLRRQLAAALKSRPGVAQVAVKDDHSLRFLGDLVDTLKAAGLEDRELMLSARPDYLLRFADSIEATLESGRVGRLSFYLLGFENFSNPELERFNKGMTGDEMLASIERLEDWAERFPGRFSINPSAGFILFTPWTSIEDLRRNHEVMTRIGFGNIRGRPLETRLRLYDRTPLFWLAKRDGLLVEEFDDQGFSDSVRRGYGADQPWRFLHSEVHAIHRRLSEERVPDEEGLELLGELLGEPQRPVVSRGDGKRRSNVRVLQVGHGSYGRLYAEEFRSAGALASVVVRSEASASQLTPAASTRLEAALDRYRPDAVAILSPTAWHAAHIAAALRRRLPSLVIKPATVHAESAQALSRHARSLGVPVHVGHEGTSAPPFRAILQVVQSGRIGRLTRVRWLKAGPDALSGGRQREEPGEADRAGVNLGFLMATTMHEIYALNRLAGRTSPVRVEVRRVVANRAAPELEASVEYSSGLEAGIRYVSAAGVPFKRGLHVIGDRGEVYWIVEPGRSIVRLRLGRRELDLPVKGSRSSRPAEAVVRAFLERVRSGQDPDETLDDGARAIDSTLLLMERVADRLGVNLQPETFSGGPEVAWRDSLPGLATEPE